MALPKEVRRVVWYTRKVAEAGRIHPSSPKADWRRRRMERLIAYKNAMREQLEQSRLT